MTGRSGLMGLHKGWLAVGSEGGERGPSPHSQEILGTFGSDLQPLHRTPPWLSPHSGWRPIHKQLVEAPYAPLLFRVTPSNLSPSTSLSFVFPTHCCLIDRCYALSLVLPSSPHHAYTCPQRGPSHSPCFRYILRTIQNDGTDHKAQEGRDLVYLEPAGSPASCIGPSIQQPVLKENTGWWGGCGSFWPQFV